MIPQNGKKIKEKRIVMLLCILAIFFVLSAAVMLLWNAILPEVIGVKSITYIQALGILVLSKILFGGFAFGKKNRTRQQFIQNGFKERLMQMSDEEEQQFKAEWRSRFK